MSFHRGVTSYWVSAYKEVYYVGMGQAESLVLFKNTFFAPEINDNNFCCLVL